MDGEAWWAAVHGVAQSRSGTVSPFRAEQGTSLETPSRVPVLFSHLSPPVSISLVFLPVSVPAPAGALSPPSGLVPGTGFFR